MRRLDQAVPTSVGHYQIIGEIARGGHGVVFEGVDTRGGSRVAIKFIPQEIMNDRFLQGNLERLSTESSVLQDLNHPGLVKFLNCGQIDNYIYFVFEYIDGVSLKKYIFNNGVFHESTFIKLAIKLAEALKFTHLQGVLHNDLSSNNIMIVEKSDGLEAKILDFGLATFFDIMSQPHDSHLGAATLFYSAPERIGIIDSPVDVRSDLFSLGCIYYEMLKGKPPYESPHSQELMQSLTTQPLSGLWNDSDTVPHYLREIVSCLLKLDPNDRYQSPVGLVKDLLAVSKSIESGQFPQNLNLHLDQRFDIVSSKTKMFGRKKELETLMKAHSLAETGVPNLTIVSGPVGIGKSRLISEFRAATVPKLSVFVSIKQENTFSNYEYGFFAEILISYIRKIQKLTNYNSKEKIKKLKNLIHDNYNLIIDFFPYLNESDVFKNFIEKKILEADSSNIKSPLKLVNFLCDLSALEKSFIFHIDEFQLMDQNSKNLLCNFLSSAKQRSLKIFFILTVTLTESEQRRSARELMESLKGSDILTQHISLKQLNQNHIQSIIIDALKASVQNLDELSSYVVNTSGGNPLLVQEIIKNLVSLESLTFSNSYQNWNFDPSKLIHSENNRATLDLMLARLQNLDADIRLILSTAASYGPKFTANIIYKIYPELSHIIPEVLRKSVSEQLISESDNVFCFTHQRIHQAFLEDHTYAPIREIHERLLRYTEQNQEDSVDYVVKLANHAYFAKSKSDGEKTLGRCFKALLALMRIHHLQPALVQAQRCFEIMDANPSHYTVEIRALIASVTGVLVSWMGNKSAWKSKIVDELEAVKNTPYKDVQILAYICRMGLDISQPNPQGDFKFSYSELSESDYNPHWLKIISRVGAQKLLSRVYRSISFFKWLNGYWFESDNVCELPPMETQFAAMALDPNEAWELYYENFTSQRSHPDAPFYIKRELQLIANLESPKQGLAKIYLSLMDCLEHGLSWSAEEVSTRLNNVRILESGCRIQGQLMPIAFSNLIFGSVFLARGDTINARQLLNEAVALGREAKLDVLPELEANLALFYSFSEPKKFNEIYFKYIEIPDLSKRTKYLLNSGHFLVVFSKDPFNEHDISLLDNVGGSPWINRWPGNVFVRHFQISRAIMDRIQKCKGRLKTGPSGKFDVHFKSSRPDQVLLVTDYIEYLIHAFVIKSSHLHFNESTIIELEHLAKESGFLNIQLIIRLVMYKLKSEWAKQLNSDLVLDEAFTHLEASNTVSKTLGFLNLEKSLQKEYHDNGFSLKQNRYNDGLASSSSHLTTFFRRARIEKVLEFSNKLSLCNGTEVFLNTILSGFIEISGSQRGFILNVSNMNNTFELMVSQNFNELSTSLFINEDNCAKVGVSWKAINSALETMKPVYGFPYEVDESFLSESHHSPYTIKSLAVIPIIHDSRIFALVYLDNQLVSRLFTPDVLWSLEPLIVQLAIHTANRWLMSSSIQQYEDLKQFSHISGRLKSNGVDNILNKINLLLDYTADKIKDQVLQINKLSALHDSNALKYSSQLLETVRKEIVVYSKFFLEIEKELESEKNDDKKCG